MIILKVPDDKSQIVKIISTVNCNENYQNSIWYVSNQRYKFYNGYNRSFNWQWPNHKNNSSTIIHNDYVKKQCFNNC